MHDPLLMWYLDRGIKPLITFINNNRNLLSVALAGRFPGIWVSGRWNGNGSSWEWIAPRPSKLHSDIPWEDGQPDHGGDCLWLLKRSKFAFDDTSCQRVNPHFLCKRKNH